MAQFMFLIATFAQSHVLLITKKIKGQRLCRKINNFFNEIMCTLSRSQVSFGVQTECRSVQIELGLENPEACTSAHAKNKKQ